MARSLPADTVRALRAARALEWLAESHDQQARARAATSRLMRACVDAGWSAIEIGAVIDLRPSTATARVRASRRDIHEPAGLEVEPPARHRSVLAEVRDVAVQDREWLTRAEAVEFAGRSVQTITQWRRAGLLPNTRRIGPRWFLYLRADLIRVVNWPIRYHGLGVDRASLLATIVG